MMLISPETWLPERPIMPAGLLAIMLGSSVEVAAPAKAFPSAEALFSRSWKADPQASPANAIPAVATTTPIASRPTQSSTAFPHILPQNDKTKRRTQTVINLVFAVMTWVESAQPRGGSVHRQPASSIAHLDDDNRQRYS